LRLNQHWPYYQQRYKKFSIHTKVVFRLQRWRSQEG
jgi:hypothetical protein